MYNIQNDLLPTFHLLNINYSHTVICNMYVKEIINKFS